MESQIATQIEQPIGAQGFGSGGACLGKGGGGGGEGGGGGGENHEVKVDGLPYTDYYFILTK